MSTYGTGTIELHRGRYRLRVPQGNGRYKTLGSFLTREEAESARRGYAALLAAGEVRTDGDTLRDYGAKWLDRREVRGSRNSTTDRCRWKLYIETARFIDWPLANISRRDVKRWLDELVKRPIEDRKTKRMTKRLSAQSIRHCANLLRACFRSALDDELVEKNPAISLDLPKATTDDVWTYLLPAEQTRLLTCPEIPEPDRLIIAFALGTGLRQSEQWSLELRDLHVDAADPHVFVRWGKPGKVPKSGKRRKVPLFGLALAAAKRWLAILPTYTKENECRLVFPTARGCRRRDSKPVRAWPKYLAAAKLSDASKRHDGRSVRWHDLRHSCASSLVAGWWGRRWRLVEVRDVLGHSSIVVTERYAHLAASELAEAASATPGAANLPPTSPDAHTTHTQPRETTGRATEDSNLWPSAPEGGEKLAAALDLGPRGGSEGELLVELAERFVRAVASRNRFATRYGLALAEKVFEVVGAKKAATPAADAAEEVA